MFLFFLIGNLAGGPFLSSDCVHQPLSTQPLHDRRKMSESIQYSDAETRGPYQGQGQQGRGL